MEKLPKNFCWRPFTQIVLNENTHRPCCFFNKFLENNKEFNKEVRDSILENKWHDGCSRCKDLEENKNTKQRSFRILYDGPKDINLVLQNKFSSKIVEVTFDKTCNFACITCNSDSSTKWRSENLRMGIEDSKKYSFNLLPYKNLNLWENVESCIIYGGEPMYSKNTLSLLKFLIENQFSQKISLTFYTNGSIINDEIADLLQTFKSCKISFSVDGTYDRLHVIRWPGDYNIIKNNFKKISKFKNTKVSVIYTYSILNATYFAEDYKIIQDELTNDIVLNSLNKPLIYAARNLPIKIKTKLIDEYSNHNNIKAKDFEIAVGELQMSAHTNSLEALIKKLKMYDSYRKTDSSILFTSDVWQLTDK